MVLLNPFGQVQMIYVVLSKDLPTFIIENLDLYINLNLNSFSLSLSRTHSITFFLSSFLSFSLSFSLSLSPPLLSSSPSLQHLRPLSCCHSFPFWNVCLLLLLLLLFLFSVMILQWLLECDAEIIKTFKGIIPSFDDGFYCSFGLLISLF